MPEKTRGQVAYETFNEQHEAMFGVPSPPFATLNVADRDRWERAVTAGIAADPPDTPYPWTEPDGVRVLGPGVVASADRSAVSWDGMSYARQAGAVTEVEPDGAVAQAAVPGVIILAAGPDMSDGVMSDLERGLAVDGATVVAVRGVQALREWTPSAELAATEAQRDKAYRERAALVAFLAASYRAVIDWRDDPEWPVVLVETPSGQMGWHFSAVDAHLVSWLPQITHDRKLWDGHTTEEKYQRLDELTRTVATGIYGPQRTDEP